MATAGSHTEDEVEFCSYCGRLGQTATERVCPDCGLGVRLRTSSDVLRGPDTPFLVVREDGRVSAASAAAERILGRHLIGRVFEGVDLRGMAPEFSACGDPPATLVVLRRA